MMEEEKYISRGVESQRDLYYSFGYKYLQVSRGRQLQVQKHHLILFLSILGLSVFFNEGHTLSLILLLSFLGALMFTHIVISEQQYSIAVILFFSLLIFEQLQAGITVDVSYDIFSDPLRFLFYISIDVLLLVSVISDSRYLSHSFVQKKIIEPATPHTEKLFENLRSRMEDTKFHIETGGDTTDDLNDLQQKSVFQLVPIFSFVLFAVNSFFWQFYSFFSISLNASERYFSASLLLIEFILLILLAWIFSRQEQKVGD